MVGRLRIAAALAGLLVAVPGVARAQNIQDLGRGLLNQLAPQPPQGRGNDADAYERGRRDAEEQRRRDEDRQRADRNDYRRNDDRRRPDMDRPNDSRGGNYDYGRGGGYNGQQNGYPGPQQRY